MSHTIKLTFNKHDCKTFELGYLNHEVDKSVRNSVVNCYYLSIDTRLSQFIEFLCTISPEQARNSKINNIRQITLKVTNSKRGQVFYNIIIKGETTGVMIFQPSELIDYQQDIEPDLSSIGLLINSIINEEESEEELLTTQNKLSFYIKSGNKLAGFRVQYKDYEYFKARGYHVYNVVLDLAFPELLDFLRISCPSKNQIEGEIEEVYLRINDKKQVASLLLYGKDTDIQDYERIDFIPTLLKDSSRNLPEFPVVEKVKSVDVKRQIIAICKEIADSRSQTTRKIDELRELLTSLSVVENKAESKKIKEVIHKAYKQELGGLHCIYVGTKTLNDGIIFKLPNWSEEERKKLQEGWKAYYSTFNCQTETHYNDGTVELGDRLEFTPTNKVQEIESSDRTGVIGYVEQVGDLIEIIYYDRFTN